MKIAIGGDISVTDACRESFAKGDADKLFNDVKDVMRKADYTIVNLECAVTESDKDIKKFGPPLKAPFGTVKALKDAGVTHCVLSNNHIFDYGKKGLYDTVEELNKYNMGYTGIGENHIDARTDLIIEGNKKIAVIAVCEHEYSYALSDRVGAREYDPYDTNDDIVKAKENADYVVVIYHGGKEHCRYPSPRLIKLCRSMVKHGADVVLCQHSHCIGCYEEFMGSHILYGQGNFHFVYPETSGKDYQWKTGLLAVADFGEECNIEFLPVVNCEGGICLAKGEEAEKLLSELKERSESLKDGSWREGWHAYCETQRDWYSRQQNPEMRDAFAHYLDCEAHSDVWRELFPTWNMTNEKD